MYEDLELQALLESIVEQSTVLWTKLQSDTARWSMAYEKAQAWLDDYGWLTGIMLKHPTVFQGSLLKYLEDLLHLWQSEQTHWQKGQLSPFADRRFASPAWQDYPWFHLLGKQYLLTKAHAQAFLELLQDEDPSLIKRARFLIAQYLDALSPDNFLPSNPEILTETVRTQGKNLLRGFNRWLSDLTMASQDFRISMTDTSAFKVGDNVAATPGKVIARTALIELIQYTPTTPQVRAIPLLLIPPWINKYYILDLSPHNSLIRFLVNAGVTVFVMSWLNPDRTHASFGLSEYLEYGPIRAIDVIKQQMHVTQVNTLGFCIGGTLQAMMLAYYQATAQPVIHTSTFLASMIDFSDPGDISVFIDESQIARLEAHMAQKGYLEGPVMANAFNMLRASDLIWSFFIKNYLKGEKPAPFDLLFWNGDTTNMPAKMHAEYLRGMYLHNQLIEPGKIIVNGVPLDVTQIDIPTFFVSTIKDHIAPWQTTYRGFQLMQGEKTFVLGGSGHIAGIVIPPGTEKYGYYVNHNHEASPEAWLENATHYTGSWWEAWLDWLERHSGAWIDAPVWSRLAYPPLADAPGQYVLRPSTQ